MPDSRLVVDKDPFTASGDGDRQVVAYEKVAKDPSLAALRPSEDLPRKALPPGHPKLHWWTFRTSHEKVGSYSTFKRVWRDNFRQLLFFRAFGTHATCDTCSRLQAQMRAAKDMCTRMRWAHQYRDHLRSQWRDRLVYWRLREQGRSLDGPLWLVCIVDGADQAKFRVVKAARWPKAMDNLHRPKLQLIGCWVHGKEASFSLREENIPKGSNVCIEVLLQTLGRVVARLKHVNQPVPSNLWIQMDNAVGENKNQFWARLLGLLVDRAIFKVVVHSYMRPGHTHEDLDALFGVLSTHIASLLEWNSPEDMRRPLVCKEPRILCS